MKFYDPTEEEISRFKISEIVEVRGIITAIRDIYLRTHGYDENGERKYRQHLSFRLLDKPFFCEEVSIDEIRKLEGKLIGQ